MKTLHGQGLQLRRDFAESVRDADFSNFKSTYGEELSDLMFDNFARPLMQAKDDIDKQKEIVGKLDLFTAAFLNPIE